MLTVLVLLLNICILCINKALIIQNEVKLTINKLNNILFPIIFEYKYEITANSMQVYICENNKLCILLIVKNTDNTLPHKLKIK